MTKGAPKNGTPKAAGGEGNGPPYAEPHELAASTCVQNAAALEPWGDAVFGKVNIVDLANELRDATRRVTRDGDMKQAEAMLFEQAMVLQTIFTNLSRRAAGNIERSIGVAETLLRLSLKAQSQCRATLETLNELKNPRPVAFVRQANIAHGPQQVNNGSAANSAMNATSPRPGETDSTPNELLEDRTHGRTQLDPGATAAAGRENSRLEPVGTVHRTPER